MNKDNSNSHSTTTTGEADAIKFVLTDLHPHPHLWAQAAAESANVSYVPYPVDAANVPGGLIGRYRNGEEGQGQGQGGKKKKVFRLFNLAFHHFGDGLARRILKGTVEGAEVGEGFG